MSLEHVLNLAKMGGSLFEICSRKVAVQSENEWERVLALHDCLCRKLIEYDVVGI